VKSTNGILLFGSAPQQQLDFNISLQDIHRANYRVELSLRQRTAPYINPGSIS